MLWETLADQGVSAHLRWIIHCLYCDQHGQVIGQSGHSRDFNIHAGVRQGCVLIPRIFCNVLQHAMRKWRSQHLSSGWDLHNGLVRFADDILLFAKSAHEAGTLLQSLMWHLRQIGLILNANKTKVLTTEAQPPSCLFIPGADPIQVLEREGCHKWLGCMLSTATSDAARWD